MLFGSMEACTKAATGQNWVVIHYVWLAKAPKVAKTRKPQKGPPGSAPKNHRALQVASKKAPKRGKSTTTHPSHFVRVNDNFSFSLKASFRDNDNNNNQYNIVVILVGCVVIGIVCIVTK